MTRKTLNLQFDKTEMHFKNQILIRFSKILFMWAFAVQTSEEF